MVEGIHRDGQGYYHPASEEEIVRLVRHAREKGRKLRVRGSAHSLARAIYARANGRERLPGDDIDVLLDRYREVIFDDAKKQVTVEAGCNLFVDPEDPSGTSTPGNGLLPQLDARGWALSDLGGITRQTVSGFLSTGSSGGSLEFSVYDDIVAFRVVSGTGEVLELSEAADADRFHAAAISMGLMGVVSTVTLQCFDRYDVRVRERISDVEDCEIKLFDDGPGGLGAYTRRTHYSRQLWWPQKRIQRIVTWEAARIGPDDDGGPTERKPYVPAHTLSPQPLRVGGGIAEVNGITQMGLHLLEQRFAGGLLRSMAGGVGRTLLGWSFPTIVKMFNPIDKETAEDGNVGRLFRDTWWQGIPMDNGYDYTILPTEFTELWIDIERTGEVMRRLKDHYERSGGSATGHYLLEIYGGKRNPFWMSPSYERDVIRMDWFWYAKNKRPAQEYFRQFFDLLKDLDFRLHWGKHLSEDAATGPGYLRAQYPRWDDWMRIRAELDPDRIFVTDYWQRRLDIPM